MPPELHAKLSSLLEASGVPLIILYPRFPQMDFHKVALSQENVPKSLHISVQFWSSLNQRAAASCSLTRRRQLWGYDSPRTADSSQALELHRQPCASCITRYGSEPRVYGDWCVLRVGRELIGALHPQILADKCFQCFGVKGAMALDPWATAIQAALDIFFFFNLFLTWLQNG